MTSFLTSSPIEIQSWPITHDETQSCDKFSHWTKVSHPRPKRKPFKRRHDVTTEASSLRMIASLSFYSTFKCWCRKIYIISVSALLHVVYFFLVCALIFKKTSSYKISKKTLYNHVQTCNHKIALLLRGKAQFISYGALCSVQPCVGNACREVQA